MDPVNQLNAMHLQESLPSALDLSMGCKQTPAKTSSVEVLDLIKKPSRSGCNSGTNDVVVGAPGSRSEGHISRPFEQVQPDVPQFDVNSERSYESRCSATPLLNPSSVSLLNGLTPVTETLSQCPASNPPFTEDSRAGAEVDKTFTHLSECPRKALIAASETTKTDTDAPLRAKGSTEGAKNPQNGFQSQSLCVKAGYSGKCTTDTVSPRTRSRGAHALQDSPYFTPPFHPSGSASFISQALSIVERHTHSTVETLSSECTGSGDESACSVECISSDSSDVIEVAVSNSTHRQPSNSLVLTRSVAGRKVSHDGEALSSPRQGSGHADGMAYSAPEHAVRGGYPATELGYRSPEKTLEPGEPSPLDSDPEIEFISKNFPSTSDIENADHALGPPRDESSSTSHSPPLPKDSPQGAPASKKKNQGSAGPKQATPGKLTRPCPGVKEAASAAKRRKRKARPSGSSSIFAPQEPEIKLRYANYKEKREDRDHGFAPYVRVELSACTIVNFREEDDDTQMRKGRQAAVSCVSPGVVPSTSRLVLGRPGAGSSTRTDQACCLCGRTSNTSGLGDLHGPYYPSGPQPNSKSPRHPIDGGAHGQPQVESPLRADGVLDSEDKSPTKRLRDQCSTDKCPGAPEGSGDCRERWVHEDCSVWSAGVFLVKGRLYGLEEVLRLTRETVCSCCDTAGATLACFFRDCPNKYHFPCAVQADCVLSEENFTMRCPKHKNKSPRARTSRLQNR